MTIELFLSLLGLVGTIIAATWTLHAKLNTTERRAAEQTVAVALKVTELKGSIDVIAANVSALEQRIGRLETGNGNGASAKVRRVR